ncbi:anti-sigma factor [Nocardioides dubius]|uniref:Regulator of SigK n=1 Tax=Nocardioides dubius TaxID=317019 RepID=A0ABN1TTQ6_9ACTN
MNDIHALTGAYAIDALDDAERIAFEAHLDECEDCRTEVAELTETATLLSGLASTEPPAGQRAAVLAAISTVRPLPPLPQQDAPAKEEQAQPIPLAPAARRRPVRRFATWAAAAAVIVGIGTGVAVTQPWADDPEGFTPSASTQVLTADDAERVTLSFPDGAQATLVRSVTEGRAVLITKDMPAPPEGKVYQVWLQSPTGPMEPAAVMPIRPDQTVLLDGDASTATAAGITVEPTGGSPEPTTEPIALFDLAGSA